MNRKPSKKTEFDTRKKLREEKKDPGRHEINSSGQKKGSLFPRD